MRWLVGFVIMGLPLASDEQEPTFTENYFYFHAHSLVNMAHDYFQDAMFRQSLATYKEAKGASDMCFIKDKVLSFQIDLGITISEAFCNKEITTLRSRLEKIYIDYCGPIELPTIPSNDKIKLDKPTGAD